MNTYLKTATSLMHSWWKKAGRSNLLELKGKVTMGVGQAADNTMHTI
jgi:hypothetical protein